MQNKDVAGLKEKIWIFIFASFLFLLDCHQKNPAEPVVTDLSLQVQTVAFNWDTSHHKTDALNLRKNFSESFVLPEYSPNNNAPALYLVQQQPIRIKVTFSLDPPLDRVLRIRGFAGERNRILSGTTPVDVRFSAGTSDTVQFLLDNPVPSALQMSDEFFRWQILENNFQGEVISGPHRIFVVFNDPATIGADSGANCWHRELVSHQAPWADALERILHPDLGNAAGQTNPGGALRNLTAYLFTRHGAEYDVYAESLNHYSRVWEKTFNFTKYLFEMQRSHRVTCFDQGGALRILGALLGIPVEVIYIARVGYIQTAPLVGIGPCNNPFFRFHGRPDASLIAEPVVNENLVKPYRTGFGNHILNRYEKKIYDATCGPQLGELDLEAYLADLIDISTTFEKEASDYPENLTIENWSARFIIFPGTANTGQNSPDAAAEYFRQCVQRHTMNPAKTR